MEFNPQKCQVLNISRAKHPIKHNYILHGQILETVSNAKYLGMDFSTDLNWTHNINRITNSANRTLGFLKRNITTKNEKVRELAYKTLIRPQVEYASTVWSPYTKQNINKVEMVQRRAVRWVKGNYSTYDSVTDMQASLEWRTLADRRTDSRLAMFHKIYHHQVAIVLPQYLMQPTRLTRHMHPFSLRQIHTGTNFFKFSFFPHTVVLWNSLPHNIAVLPDADSFKRAVGQLAHS